MFQPVNATINIFFLPVSLALLFLSATPAVLTSNSMVMHFFSVYFPDSIKTSTFLFRISFESKEVGASMAIMHSNCKHVILHHISQCTGLFIIASPVFHPYRFRRRDLYMINIIAIPDGLKHGIGKTKSQYILYCFFTQVMINPEDLLFVKYAA